MYDRTLDREAIAAFQQWLDVPEEERGTWLATRTIDRPDLHERLEALIRADSTASIATGGAMSALDIEAIPERVGAYRINGVIGRGGMGAVYRGERDSGDFTRTVAIKVIKAGVFSLETVRRFHTERQTLAMLSHPNIAALYDGGETETGSPYFVMEFVDGAPLLEWAHRASPARPQRLALFGDICAAVAFAHSRLIVHRDLSPANVLVTQDGVVKLIDFGIAKPSDEHATNQDIAAAQLTVTPGYSAPERFTQAQVTTAGDVYSLGRLLDELTKPSARDRELRAIIARATSADPSARYPSAEALAAEILALRTRRPVAAYSAAPIYMARKFVARHAGAVGASAAGLATLIVALVVTLNANVAAERARLEAERRFEETRAIAKMMLFEVFDEVSATAGSTNAREMLA
ncbi:MAG TPA: serine/threonine-protein kinase, partial [Verrucomicrobiae bacterium]|nr:serine/threonine-protein kinase [Verrucomicrobiae bacterium]